MCCLTGQYNSAKKRSVQLAVISGWHYQNKSCPVVVVDCDSNVISSFFKIVFKFSFGKLFKVIKKRFIKISLTYLLFDLFCDNNNYSFPPPPTSLHTEIQTYKLIYMLWLNFILGLNFIFFCLNSLSYITIPKNLPTLVAWEIAFQRKQRCHPRM